MRSKGRFTAQVFLSCNAAIARRPLPRRASAPGHAGLYGKGVTPVPLGTVELWEGGHRLRFTAVDKNPKSTDYFIGIDYIQLTPAQASRPR